MCNRFSYAGQVKQCTISGKIQMYAGDVETMDRPESMWGVGAVPIYLSMPPVANSNQHSALCPALMLLLRLVLISLLLILEHLAE